MELTISRPSFDANFPFVPEKEISFQNSFPNCDLGIIIIITTTINNKSSVAMIREEVIPMNMLSNLRLYRSQIDKSVSVIIYF
jgi:hypothetical protein